MKYKIIVDKQSRANPSTEKKEYEIDIEELRYKGNVHDSLIITKDEDYVIRRLSLSGYHVLSVLPEPIKEPLQNINIELFEGDNYIYLVDMTGNKLYAEYLIKNEFNDVYITKSEAYSAITETANEIDLSVNQKLENYSTTEEMNVLIQLLSNQINLELSKKVNGETITGAYLLLKINGDTSTAKLSADKIELTANDVLNLLAGNTINLTSKNIIFDSDKFKTDKNGKVTCSDIDITGGQIKLKSDEVNALLEVMHKTNSKWFSRIFPRLVVVNSDEGTAGLSATLGYGMLSMNHNGISTAGIIGKSTDPEIFLQTASGTVFQADKGGVTTPKVTQTSVKSKKKNIKKLKVNALELIKNADICLYNLKTEKKGSKQHIGLIIDKEGKYNCPVEVISEDKQGVEQYSMTSLAWKAIQELVEENKKLKGRIEKLEAK